MYVYKYRVVAYAVLHIYIYALQEYIYIYNIYSSIAKSTYITVYMIAFSQVHIDVWSYV